MKQCDKNIYGLLIVLALIVIGIITVKFAYSYFSNFYETMDNANTDNANTDNANTNKKMILFYWTDCGHCKKMMPIWDKLQQDYPQYYSKIEKTDITPAQENEFNITGYPVIFMTKNNKKYKEYNGDRTYDAIKNFFDSE